MIPSYPSIYALGHKVVAEIFVEPVVVQEKVDGSQISFSLDVATGQLRARSKGAELNLIAPDKMFAAGVAEIQKREDELRCGWVYRGEYLAKPNHNALAYDRIPKNHIILFDINPGLEDYLPPVEVALEADRLGFEMVPTIYHGMVTDTAMFRELLLMESILGGQRIEGVVVKNYARFGPDKKALMAKFVSEAFKEVHAKVWGENNPKQGDILERIGVRYTTAARWEKALQHLRDAGQIQDAPQDIGLLIREVWPDISRECAEEIAQELYDWAEPALRRMVTRGLPEWYKQRLLERQFQQAA